MTYLKYDGSAVAQSATPASGLFGTSALDTLVGTAAAESLWGGEGDLMKGAAGDDTYYIKNAADRVVELAGDGVDTVHAWTSLYLGDFDNVENVTVGGDNTYAAGNGLDNLIQGEAGNQQIYGGGGQDVLVGGAGKDVLIVYKGEGNDAVADFAVGEDVIRLKAGFTSFGEVQGRLSQVGADTKIDLGDGDGLMLRGVQSSQLTAANFQLQFDASRLGAQTFADEFSGPLSIWDAESNPTGKWRPDFGYQGADGYGSYTLASNDEKQIYTSPYFKGHAGDFAESPFTSNSDGTLSIWARPSSNSEIFGYGYTSGMITTKESHAQTYGYFEMRADIPDAEGAWPAFWMIPADGSWPPELDIMETLTSDPRGAWTTEHSSTGGHTAHGQLSFIPDTASGMHTYGALWTQTDLVWYVDGVEVFRQDTPADMHKPMFMIANLALGGWGGAITQGDLPAEFKIDYIRAYGLGDLNVPAPPVAQPAPTPTVPPPVTTPPVVAPPATNLPGAVLTASQPGSTLTGGAGNDTINASQGADQLTGGAGADTFAFKALPWSAGHIKDFQLGVDKLDLSALYQGGYTGNDPVADGYVRFESDGAGGAKVMLDIDAGASTNPWAYQIAILDGVSPTGLTAAQVFGGAPAAPVPAPAPVVPGLSLTSTGYGETLTGGAGNDTLNAAQGPDRLVGGAGADRFVFDDLPWNAGHVADFKPGEDKLDLRDLFADAGYHGSNPMAEGFLKFESDGAGGTKVLFDTDGPGAANPWPFQVTTLDGVAPSSLTASDWIFQ